MKASGSPRVLICPKCSQSGNRSFPVVKTRWIPLLRMFLYMRMAFPSPPAASGGRMAFSGLVTWRFSRPFETVVLGIWFFVSFSSRRSSILPGKSVFAVRRILSASLIVLVCVLQMSLPQISSSSSGSPGKKSIWIPANHAGRKAARIGRLNSCSPAPCTAPLSSPAALHRS